MKRHQAVGLVLRKCIRHPAKLREEVVVVRPVLWSHMVSESSVPQVKRTVASQVTQPVRGGPRIESHAQHGEVVGDSWGLVRLPKERAGNREGH